MWKDFFYFTKREQRGILLLIALIAGIFIGKVLFSNKEKTLQPDSATELQQDKQATGKQKGNKTDLKSVSPVKKLQVFDPNTADSITFATLGIKPYVIRNILKYRNKGGQFRKAGDFRKIYGLDKEKAAELEPYILIRKAAKENRSNQTKSDSIVENNALVKQRNDSVDTYKPDRSFSAGLKREENIKYAPGIKLDINSVDSVELKKIPGIGSVFAFRILKYRKILGGFYSVDQIKEVYGIDGELFDKISQWMRVEDHPVITKIPVNRSSLDRLKMHPYINFYQAKTIVELRKKRGNLNHISELRLLEEFTDQDLERLTHYLEF